jgi:hypothetical protein
MKYSIHILTTHKYADRQKAVLNTWLKGRDNYIFYTDKKLDVGNQEVVCENDTYFSNGFKNLAELNRINFYNLHENVDWMLFCDDDTFVNLPKLELLLPTLDTSKVYGHILTWAVDRTLLYCSGGAGYLVSSKLLKKFGPPSFKYLNTSLYADVCVGLWCRENSILVENVPGFHSQPPKVYNLNEIEISNSITFHYIKTLDEQAELARICNL